MRSFVVAMAFVVSLVMAGCEERTIRAPSGSRQQPDSAVNPPQGQAFGAAPVGIPECAGFENAPPSSPAALVGSWGYINAMLFYPSEEPIWSEAVGTLVLGADGRYDIDRQMENTGLKYGPGDWTFDGATLTLTPDDGSFTETYNHIIATDMALTLVNSDDTGCMVYFLGPSA